MMTSSNRAFIIYGSIFCILFDIVIKWYYIIDVMVINNQRNYIVLNEIPWFSILNTYVYNFIGGSNV